MNCHLVKISLVRARRKKRMHPTKRRMMVIKRGLLATNNTMCASSSAVKEVAVASVVVEEAKAAEVAATSRTRTALKESWKTVKRGRLVNSAGDLAVASRRPPRSIRKVRPVKTRKVARASVIVSIGASVVKREAEVEEVTAEDPEGVAALVVEAIVRTPRPIRLTMRKAKVPRVIRMLREIVKLVAAAEVADAVVAAEPPLLRVKKKLPTELMARTAVEAEEAVAATERTVVVAAATSKTARARRLAKAVTDLLAAAAVTATITVPRVKATTLNPKHTRASTTRTARNINRSRSRSLRLSLTLARTSDWRSRWPTRANSSR